MDDPTIRGTHDRTGRTTLAALIAEAPEGLDAGRVLRWAEQLAIQIDLRHEQRIPCGAVIAGAITIDGNDAAQLQAEPGERELLLGAEPRDGDVLALAALIHEAFGGAPGSGGEVLPGVSVQVNLALRSVLAPGGKCPSTAAALVEMLRGGPVPGQPPNRASRRTVPVPVAAGAVLGALVLGFLLLPVLDRAGAPESRAADASRAAEDLLAIDRDLHEAAARRARARFDAVAAGEPAPLFDRIRPEAEELKTAARRAELLHEQGLQPAAREAWDGVASAFGTLLERHREARRIAAEASAEWRDALAAQPAQWLDDAEVGCLRDEAAAIADAAAAAMADGRFEEARQGWERAAGALHEASAIHSEGLARRASPLPGPDIPQTPASGGRRPRHGEIEVNTLSQTLVYLGPGRFDMGSPATEPFRGPGEERHSVELTAGFWITRVEVTRGSFATFVETTGYESDAERQGWSHGLDPAGRWRRIEGLSWRDPGFHQSDSHPVVCVSFDDAEAYCRWLSAREDRVYRLPTEAEWEYAHRAGTGASFAWGDDPFASAAFANAADESWRSRVPESVGFPWQDGYVFTSPVATFAANAWGLFDMEGNVAEWCLDAYVPYDPDDSVDPRRTADGAAGDRSPRVLRGGSFASPPADCRAAHRDASNRTASFVTVGFRLVMEGAAP